MTPVPRAPQDAGSSQRPGCLDPSERGSALKRLPLPVLQGTLQSGFGGREARACLKEEAETTHRPGKPSTPHRAPRSG